MLIVGFSSAPNPGSDGAAGGAQGTAPAETNEDWSLLVKLAMVCAVVAVLALWIGVWRGGQSRDRVGYEKTLA